MLSYILFLCLHPLYVSVTDLVVDRDEQSIQMTKKIFFDDLELALRNENKNQTFDILQSNQNVINSYIETYLKKNIFIKINNNEVEMKYLGHEYTNGLINCYLEILNISNLVSFEIKDITLFNYFDGQENLIYFDIEDERFTIRLKNTTSSKKIIF